MSEPNPDFMAGADEFATVRQLEYLEAVRTHGNAFAASRALGRHHSTIQQSLQLLEKKAATKDRTLHLGDKVAPGFAIKGTSTYFDRDGRPAGQWVKTNRDDSQSEEMVRQMVLAMTDDVRGKAPIITTPALCNKDLLVVYPMGDPHFGLYAWGKETGDPFNLEIAERLLCAAIDNLVASAPPAETAILLNLGDFFHVNDQSNQTQSGHQLDADSRWQKMMQVGLRAMLYAINKLRAKHARVVVRNVKGNHDKNSSFALALALDAFFSNTPEVFVDLSPADFWFYRFDKVLIGSTHGDQCKKEALPGVMACDRPLDWGATSFRYFMIGHVHHDEVKEFPGCTVESFRTLAAKDAWHAGKGYRSGRDMRCIIMHKQYGEIGRYRCDISMIENAAKDAA